VGCACGYVLLGRVEPVWAVRIMACIIIDAFVYRKVVLAVFLAPSRGGCSR
jgi:hypothetical protein